MSVTGKALTAARPCFEEQPGDIECRSVILPVDGTDWGLM